LAPGRSAFAERLVAQRTRPPINDLRWALHDLWPEVEVPPRALIHARWQEQSGAPHPRRADHAGTDRS